MRLKPFKLIPNHRQKITDAKPELYEGDGVVAREPVYTQKPLNTDALHIVYDIVLLFLVVTGVLFQWAPHLAGGHTSLVERLSSTGNWQRRWVIVAEILRIVCCVTHTHTWKHQQLKPSSKLDIECFGSCVCNPAFPCMSSNTSQREHHLIVHAAHKIHNFDWCQRDKATTTGIHVPHPAFTTVYNTKGGEKMGKYMKIQYDIHWNVTNTCRWSDNLWGNRALHWEIHYK